MIMKAATRRDVLRASALGVAAGAVGTVRAQSDARITGTLVAASGADLGGDQISSLRGGTIATGIVGENGEFEVSAPGNSNIELVLHDGGDDFGDVHTELNGVPQVYEVDKLSVDSDTVDVGELTIPEAYETTIRFIDEGGSPVTDVTPQIRSAGYGFEPGVYKTLEDGYVKTVGASHNRIELVGPVRIEAETSSGGVVAREKINVTDASEIEVTVAGATNGDSTFGDSGPDSGSTRGFFSNDGTDPAFLRNPLNLTTAGFALSVGGIAHQLFGKN